MIFFLLLIVIASLFSFESFCDLKAGLYEDYDVFKNCLRTVPVRIFILLLLIFSFLFLYPLTK